MDDVLTFKEKKKIVDYIVEEILNEEYWDELQKISSELNKLLEAMGEKNGILTGIVIWNKRMIYIIYYLIK